MTGTGPGAGSGASEPGPSPDREGQQRAQAELSDANDDVVEAHDKLAEAQENLAEAHDNAGHSGSLFEPIGEVDDDNPYGVPGSPVSRLSPFYRGFLGAAGVLLAFALAVGIREVESVLVLILVSAFLAVGLNPIVEFFIRRGLKRGVSVLIVGVVVLGIFALIVFVLVGVLRDQIASFIDRAPKLLATLRDHKTIRHLDDKYHVISNLQSKLKDPDLAEDTFRGIFNTGLGLLNAVADTVIAFVLTFYFLVALPQLKRAMYSLAPASRRIRVGQLGDEILRRVGGFVIGAFLVALLAGTVTFIFLMFAGLGQYALPLALFVALLDLVPLVGSIAGAAVVSLVCLATSLDVGIAAVIFYLIYEPLEGYVIYPRVMRSSVDVPEYVTIIAVLLGGTLGGVVGALLALPVAAGVLLLAREVWVRRQDIH